MPIFDFQGKNTTYRGRCSVVGKCCEMILIGNKVEYNIELASDFLHASSRGLSSDNTSCTRRYSR